MIFGSRQGEFHMPRIKLYTSYAWLRRKWVVEKLTEKEIADIAGTTQVTINRYLKQFGLRKER